MVHLLVHVDATWETLVQCLVIGSQQVPVLDFEGQRLNESYQIIKWLDKQFPNSPQLRNGHPAGMLCGIVSSKAGYLLFLSA